MAETVPLKPEHVIQITHVAQETLRPAVERDWSVKAGRLGWDCRQTLDHMVGAPLFHGTNLAMRSTRRLPNPRAGNPNASIGELLDTLEYTATLLARLACEAAPEARGFTNGGMADAQGFLATSSNEILLHTHDITEGLGLRFQPPAELAELVLHRLYPWAPRDVEPWAAMLWVSCRGSLPGRPDMAANWVGHAAPLSEWDGQTIPMRGA
ncbi:MAG TPA: hypothetical protein VMW62_18545 [Chloroflexota bacterium]|nr:hypothetical protein [Chloroflexota bacterium]